MRRQRFVLGGLLALATCLLLGPTLAAAGPVVVQAAGPDAESIQPVVDVFREALGDLNPNVAGSFPTGRREINWDGVPDNFAAPNLLPPDFFNVNSPRGAVFETPGSGVQVSANLVNPTNTPIEFGNINPTYPDIFRTFSPQRLFTALDSTITVVHFFVPGSNTPATVSGFGAVFTDVDIPTSTKIEYFDAHDKLLFRAFVQPLPKQDETLSFLGVRFDEGERIAKVRITSGNAKLSPTTFDGKSDRRDNDKDDDEDKDNDKDDDEDKDNDKDDDKDKDNDKDDDKDDKSDRRVVDLVVMDDFIYGEPQAR